MSFAFEQASGRAVVRAGRVARCTLLGAAAVLALAQLGVDTTILLVIVAVFGGSIGPASALLVGFGGRDIAREIAAGRYLSRYIDVDATITVDSETRTVLALHPASIEVTGEAGATHLPYTALLEKGFRPVTSPPFRPRRRAPRRRPCLSPDSDSVQAPLQQSSP